jgi:hypothetical protein
MASSKMIGRRFTRVAEFATLVLSLLSFATGSTRGPETQNLALNKPATCSSIENDEHNAAAANDGDPHTCWRADDEPEGAKPNIIFVLADDLGIDGVSCYGADKHQTPQIDALAASGTRFRPATRRLCAGRRAAC